jgi:hypothetical protein
VAYKSTEIAPTDGERAKAAHMARLEGLSWNDAAEAAGFKSRQEAQTEVRVYLQRAAMLLSKEEKLERLELEVERLDTLQANIWDLAMKGDIKAVDACVRIINTRAKLLGLETLHETEHIVHKTMIIQGETADYVRGLRTIAGEVEEF